MTDKNDEVAQWKASAQKRRTKVAFEELKRELKDLPDGNPKMIVFKLLDGALEISLLSIEEKAALDWRDS